MSIEVKLRVLGDPRLTELEMVGCGEGSAVFVGKFEGRPAYIVDGGLCASMLDPDERAGLGGRITVEVFEDAAGLEGRVEQSRRANPRGFRPRPESA